MDPGDRTILIIEDDLDLANLVALLLKRAGYEVLSAPDAVNAIPMAKRHRPDLVILDLGLPGGGGIKVLERLRALGETMITPVLILTGRSAGDARDEVLAAGAQGFLEKPVEAETLLASVSRLLDGGADELPSEPVPREPIGANVAGPPAAAPRAPAVVPDSQRTSSAPPPSVPPPAATALRQPGPAPGPPPGPGPEPPVPGPQPGPPPAPAPDPAPPAPGPEPGPPQPPGTPRPI
jgi:CheY-like chemotaxis protein